MSKNLVLDIFGTFIWSFKIYFHFFCLFCNSVSREISWKWGTCWFSINHNEYQRKQRVVLNGEHSSWANVEAGVSQGSILGPLFFLICIKDLLDALTTNPKLFMDDTSLFSVIHNTNSTANDLNSDLMKISDWAFQ